MASKGLKGIGVTIAALLLHCSCVLLQRSATSRVAGSSSNPTTAAEAVQGSAREEATLAMEPPLFELSSARKSKEESTEDDSVALPPPPPSLPSHEATAPQSPSQTSQKASPPPSPLDTPFSEKEEGSPSTPSAENLTEKPAPPHSPLSPVTLGGRFQAMLIAGKCISFVADRPSCLTERPPSHISSLQAKYSAFPLLCPGPPPTLLP